MNKEVGAGGRFDIFLDSAPSFLVEESSKQKINDCRGTWLENMYLEIGIA